MFWNQAFGLVLLMEAFLSVQTKKDQEKHHSKGQNLRDSTL
jgi:hypothetical protein